MESYIYNIVSRICVCPVCINALSDCVIVYSGFCGCIQSFYCVFWFLFFFIIYFTLLLLFSHDIPVSPYFHFFIVFAIFVSHFFLILSLNDFRARSLITLSPHSHTRTHALTHTILRTLTVFYLFFFNLLSTCTLVLV